MPDLLTATDVAKILKCSRSMVYKLHDRGELPASFKLFQGAKGFRWTSASVDAYIERCKILLDNARTTKPSQRYKPITLANILQQ